MKKIGVFVFIILMSILLVNAEENSTSKAFSCLEGKVKDKCASLPFEEQVFSLLALSYNSGIQSECKNALLTKAKNNECFPASSCNIKDTSQALLALDSINYDTKNIEKWIIKSNITPSDIEWHIEIDSSSATNCTISYDTKNVRIKINEDKSISSFTDSCLSAAFDSNWVKINSACLKKKYTVSCDQDFITTILYKKANSNVWRITPTVKSESANGKIEHEINFYCFSTSSTCSFEENLWAVLALQKAGYNLDNVIPYLNTLYEDFPKLFPESFLYSITSSTEYLTKIVQYQKPEGYWEQDSGKKFYHTAQALLVTPDSDAKTSAKEWLVRVQDNSGCFNSGNIRDTAFILWSAYHKAAVGGSDSGDTLPDCEVTDSGFCMTASECDGNILDQFSCAGRGGIQVCCTTQKDEETCNQKEGMICTNGKVCSAETVNAKDTSDCCLTECIEETNECESEGYSCYESCSNSQETINFQCNSGNVCCKAKTVESSGNSYWWIYVLIILIILVILGIIFRHRLQMFFHKFSSGKGDVPKTRPPFFPPTSPMRPPSRPQPLPRAFPPAIAKPKTDKDLDDTFRKLREMSK